MYSIISCPQVMQSYPQSIVVLMFIIRIPAAVIRIPAAVKVRSTVRMVVTRIVNPKPYIKV